MASFNSKIRLEIISALNDAGIKATADQLDQLQNKVNSVETNAGTLGDTMKQKFSPMTAISAAMTGNFQTLGFEIVKLGAAMKGVTLSLGAFTGIGLAIGVAVAGVKKLVDLFGEQKRAAKEAADATAKAFSTNVTNAVKAFEAEYKLAMEKTADPSKTRKEFIKRQKMDLEAMGNQLASYERQATEKMAAKRKEIEDSIKNDRFQNVLHNFSSEDGKEYLRRRVNREMAKWTKDNSDELYGREIKALVTAINDTDKNIKKMEKEAVDEEKKAAEEKARNEKETADKIKAIQEAAKMEEMKLEDERHRQRMKNLEDEAKAAKSQLNEAKTRFEREFSLYKSADKGASAIEAEKADEAARKQLQKDAARYGGKWRIDELSRLYAAGDEDAVKSTLSAWRKSKSFTPEVEAMVRAAAAGENVKSMEDRVAEIAENTKGLAAKVEELLTMKGE